MMSYEMIDDVEWEYNIEKGFSTNAFCVTPFHSPHPCLKSGLSLVCAHPVWACLEWRVIMTMLDSIRGRFPIDNIRDNRNRDGASESVADLLVLTGIGRNGGQQGEGISRQGLPAIAVKTCSRRHMAGWRIVGSEVDNEEGVDAEGLGWVIARSETGETASSSVCDWEVRDI
jgi:hypothetical protein